MKEFFNQINWKFFGGFTALIAIGLLIWYIGVSLSPEAREERAAREHLKNLQEQYENDTFGGETPEETIQLFIEALEAGDIDLATKYFVIDKQAERKKILEEIKEKGQLVNTVKSVKMLANKYSLIEGDDSRFIFEALNEAGELILQVDVARGPNGKWKILDL